MNEPDVARHDDGVLDLAQCWALLRTTPVGRLAVQADTGPEIFPVNFTVDGGTIVFRTAEGAKLDGVVAATEVAFEADGWSMETGVAWSVIVRGRAAPAQQFDDIVDMFGIEIDTWHPGPKPVFVRIDPSAVSGRRFRISPPRA